MERKKSNFLGKILSYILVLFVCFGLITNAPLLARAEEKVYTFDNTEVLSDLESSGTFDINDYPWDYYGIYKSPSIANFVEWCYSPFKSEEFALYIYFYNPQNLQINTSSASNKIQMASAYSSYPITRESVPTDYDTYNLVFCSKSTRENYEGLFYKFRVVDEKGSDGLYIRERVYSGERRYDVSGITFTTLDGKVQEIGAGGTYFFNGFAAGYGPSSVSESTLECSEYRALETISIDVHPTYYRQAGWSDLGAGHQWDINSVYFSIPERYFDDFGNLQKIKAEWFEYETTDILVSNDQAAINAFLPYAGIEIPTTTLGSYNSALRYGYVFDNYSNNTSSFTDVYGYNLAKQAMSDWTIGGLIFGTGAQNYHTLKNKINYFFYTPNAITSSSSEVLVSTEKLTNYMKSYNATFNNGYLPVEIDGQKISADLFKTTLSSDRQKIAYVGDDVHHKVVEFDANDEFNMLSYDANHNGWERFWNNVFGGTPIDEKTDISPIVSDVSDYIELSDSNLAKMLLINSSDAKAFKEFYNTAKGKVNSERTVLFRFAKTDYQTEKGFTYKYKSGTNKFDADSEKDAMLTSQSVFLNFDILKLTFLDADGKYAAIPVVSDPDNIINDVSSRPENQAGWLDKLLNTVRDFFEMVGRVLGFVGVLLLGLGIIFGLIIAITFLLKLINNIPGKVIKIILYVALGAAVLLLMIFALPFWVEQLIVLGGAILV